MAFMKQLHHQMAQEKQTTENGAVGYHTSGKHLLDANFAVSSMRNWSEQRIVKLFAKAYYENPLLAVKWLFYLRDIRGNGMGERHTFRICLKWLMKNHADYAENVVPLIPEYGRFDDWLSLLDTPVHEKVIQSVKDQLMADLDAMKMGGQVSLLAKWMPSCNTSSEATKRQARVLYQALGMLELEYRKMLSGIRAYLNVAEVQMSANRWFKIEYSRVTSRANLLYGNAFLKHDGVRRREFLSKLTRGEAKIHADVLFPGDIVAQYYRESSRYMWRMNLQEKNDTLEALWKALPDYVQNDENTLVVRDGSGSMMKRVGGTNVTALQVATALAIYFSERCQGEFHDQFITFSEHPRLVSLEYTESLRDKLEICDAYDECANTDVPAVFRLILDTAVSHHMKQDDLPKNILILSDMEFDAAVRFPGCRRWEWEQSDKCTSLETLFKKINRAYEAQGYQMPRLVFWNICSRTNTVPLQQNEAGVALISGFSPAVYQMVLSNELDPYRCLLEQLNAKRYDMVEQALKERSGNGL